MVRLKGILAGIVALAAMSFGVQAQAANIISAYDSGTLTTTFPPGPALSTNVPNPYAGGTAVITPVTNGWKLTFNISSGFFASANNLAGGKTSNFDGLVSFDIDFGSAITLTTNVFEDGIYAKSGNGTVAVNRGDTQSGIVVSQIDNLLVPESHGNSFAAAAIVDFKPEGVWTLYDKVTGFNQAYRKYHVVIDNVLIAEALASPNPGFAAIAKKDFSIIFTTDGSNGGGPNVPEPASLGVLALGSLALIARRRK